jgi:hypothetical protein
VERTHLNQQEAKMKERRPIYTAGDVRLGLDKK